VLSAGDYFGDENAEIRSEYSFRFIATQRTQLLAIENAFYVSNLLFLQRKHEKEKFK
jgi:hypothetical protein